VRIADRVSYAMGTWQNIVVWIILVGTWFALILVDWTTEQLAAFVASCSSRRCGAALSRLGHLNEQWSTRFASRVVNAM